MLGVQLHSSFEWLSRTLCVCVCCAVWENARLLPPSPHWLAADFIWLELHKTTTAPSVRDTGSIHGKHVVLVRVWCLSVHQTNLLWCCVQQISAFSCLTVAFLLSQRWFFFPSFSECLCVVVDIFKQWQWSALFVCSRLSMGGWPWVFSVTFQSGCWLCQC